MPAYRRLVPILAILISAHSFAADGEKYALLIGVGEYRQDSGLANLKYAEKDMAALGKAFESNGFDPKHITVLTQSGPGNDLSKPRRENIERELTLLLGNKIKEDTIIVAFSGHGLQFGGETDAYFCPSDARRTKGAIDKTTLLDLNAVFKQFDSCKAGNKLLISDCCRNDPKFAPFKGVNDAVDSVTRPPNIAPPQSVAALYSCAEGEEAFEDDDELKGGVFTHFLIEGLKGGAALDGEVDVASLSAYLKRHVYDYVHRVFKAAQTPDFKMNIVKPFILAKITKAAAFELRKVADAASQDTDAFSMEENGHSETLQLERTPLLDQTAVKSASLGLDVHGEPQINIAFTDAGAKRFETVTRENIDKRIAMVLNGKLVSAPVIRNATAGGRASISGNLSVQQAEELVRKINAAVAKP